MKVVRRCVAIVASKLVNEVNPSTDQRKAQSVQAMICEEQPKKTIKSIIIYLFSLKTKLITKIKNNTM